MLNVKIKDGSPTLHLPPESKWLVTGNFTFICGDTVAKGQVSLRGLWLSAITLIPSLPHVHFVDDILTRRTKGSSLGTIQQSDKLSGKKLVFAFFKGIKPSPLNSVAYYRSSTASCAVTGLMAPSARLICSSCVEEGSLYHTPMLTIFCSMYRVCINYRKILPKPYFHKYWT